MISFIQIKNFAVVEKTELDFSPGFNVLTGETGAGKSIIIDALSLLFKKKIQPHLFRNIEEKLVCEVMFELDEEEIVIRREATKKKSVSFINGSMTPFNQVAQLTQSLLNIYGQNEHIFLLNSKNHMLLLDMFCKNDSLLNKLTFLSENLTEKVHKLKELKSSKQSQLEKIDFIRFQLKELADLNMTAGDDSRLRQESKILTSAEEIVSKSSAVIQELFQGETSVYNRIAEQHPNLDYLQEIYPELVPFKKEIDHFYNLLPELSESLSRLTGSVEYNEKQLDEIESRLLKLKQLEDKYQTDLNGLLEKQKAMKLQLDDLTHMDFHIDQMEKEIDTILEDYRKINLQLRQSRKSGSEKLSKQVETELAKLEMPKAQFLVHIEENEAEISNFSPKGTDQVEFHFSSNPGQAVEEIRKVASGGELSRLMLVLKSITDDTENATYIFDEIDTGIGGKTAEFVGHKLKSISKRNQVICISHLPQIAAFADKHFLIKKEFRDNHTFSYTEELSDENRVTEIGRLMAGSNMDESILNAARSLLQKTKTN